MKKSILYITSAIIGIVMGILLHCSFMVVEAEGCLMLPTIEPGQKVIVSLLDDDVKEGDVVAVKPPYYTLEGEGNIIFRRVQNVGPDELTLKCDGQLTRESTIKISKQDILGKVIFLDFK